MSVPDLVSLWDRNDTAFLRWTSKFRTDWLTDVALFIAAMGSRWTIRILRWTTIGVLIGVRRWRQLITFLAVILLTEVLVYQMSLLVRRPRPFGVEILLGWKGYSYPAISLAELATTLIGMAYALVPAGRGRDIAKWFSGIAISLLWIAYTYLGAFHLTDLVHAVIIGVAVPVVLFRWFCPNDVFPVTYRRGKSAHLDVGGTRGDAIRRALKDQLGFTVEEMKPVGLSGSGASTPLRLKVAELKGRVFAKLLARNNLRADRFYKFGRMILYGRLEDETPYRSVRQLVESEDYTIRLLRDAGIPVAKCYGIVEITPEREYVLVTEFFDGAVEIGEATVDDRVVDSGLQIVRRMWDAGLAHRDIKPANLLVRDGRVLVIDTGFVQNRPSPWRQAVDLGNMMLVLALRSDVRRVYERALRYFTPEEIAEAFAATQGIASPTQLRANLKEDERDLLAEFRALAPHRRPIKIQSWSLRRVWLTIATAVGALLLLLIVISNWAAFA